MSELIPRGDHPMRRRTPRGTGPVGGTRASVARRAGREGGDERVIGVQGPVLAGALEHPEREQELLLPLGCRELLLLQVTLVEDGVLRAHGLAGPAVDALSGVDVHLPIALVDAVHRAFADAGLILDVDTCLRDDVWHRCVPPVGAGDRRLGSVSRVSAYGAGPRSSGPTPPIANDPADPDVADRRP